MQTLMILTLRLGSRRKMRVMNGLGKMKAWILRWVGLCELQCGVQRFLSYSCVHEV